MIIFNEILGHNFLQYFSYNFLWKPILETKKIQSALQNIVQDIRTVINVVLFSIVIFVPVAYIFLTDCIR